MSHTYATLAVSAEAFREIRERLRAAGRSVEGDELDMQGIALVEEDKPEEVPQKKAEFRA